MAQYLLNRKAKGIAVGSALILAAAAPTLAAPAVGTSTSGPVSLPSKGGLVSVSAVSVDDVWAVGWQGSSPVTKALIEHWDGQAWSTSQSPSPCHDQVLYGVTATSSTDAWAVGECHTQQSVSALIEHWDGTRWSVVSGADLHGHNNGLGAVSSTSANDAWAVGSASHPAGTLIEHWDGTSWTRVASPSPGRHGGNLDAVVATSPSDAWSAGERGIFGRGSRTLMLHWDGVRWAVVPHYNPPGPDSLLSGLAAASSSDVWAVGFGEGSEGGFAEHWDGTTWSQSKPPIHNPQNGGLNAATVISSNDVWAVGTQQTREVKTLTEHWNGTKWKVVSSPTPPGSLLAIMYGVSAVSTSDVWAVGIYSLNYKSYAPFIEHWDGTSWTLM